MDCFLHQWWASQVASDFLHPCVQVAQGFTDHTLIHSDCLLWENTWLPCNWNSIIYVNFWSIGAWRRLITCFAECPGSSAGIRCWGYEGILGEEHGSNYLTMCDFTREPNHRSDQERYQMLRAARACCCIGWQSFRIVSLHVCAYVRMLPMTSPQVMARPG